MENGTTDNSVYWRRRIALGLGVVAAIVGVQIVASEASEEVPTMHFVNGDLVAGALVENALYDIPGSIFEGGPSVGEEFETADGVTCRTFAHQAGEGTACLDGDRWRIVEFRQPLDGMELASPLETVDEEPAAIEPPVTPVEPEAPVAPTAPDPD